MDVAFWIWELEFYFFSYHLKNFGEELIKKKSCFFSTTKDLSGCVAPTPFYGDPVACYQGNIDVK